MFDLNSNTLYYLLTTITLLFTGNVVADNHAQKQKTIYKVDFDNSKTHTKASNNNGKESNTNGPENSELKILLFAKGQALLLEPGAIPGTKLSYGSTDDDLEHKMAELENQGVKYVICTPPTNVVKGNNEKNSYKTNNNNTATDAELTRLRDMGYKCADP